MPLDWDKINQQKKKLDSKLSGSRGPRAKFWHPNPGENRIRIMPGWTDEGTFAGQFWREVGQHWNVSDSQRGPVICPQNTPDLEGNCPVCEFVDKLKDHPGDLRAQELVKSLRSRSAFLLNIIDLDDSQYTAKDVAEFKQNRPDGDLPFDVGDVKVQVYAAPSTVFNQILNVIQINETDITNPDTGHDVTITKSGKGLTTRYQTTIKLKPTPAPEGGTLNALDQVGYVMGEDKLLELLTDGVGGDYVGLLSGGSDDTLGALEAGESDQSDDYDDLRARMQAELAGS